MWMESENPVSSPVSRGPDGGIWVGPCRRCTTAGMWARKAGLLERGWDACQDLPGADPEPAEPEVEEIRAGVGSGWWPLKISGLQGHPLCFPGPSTPRLRISNAESGLRRSARIWNQGPQLSAVFIGGLFDKDSPELEKLWRLCGVPCWSRSPNPQIPHMHSSFSPNPPSPPRDRGHPMPLLSCNGRLGP